MPQDHFRIGANIRDEGHFIFLIRRFGQDNRSHVSANMACNTGQDIDARAFVHHGANMGGTDGLGLLRRKRERRATQFNWIDAEKQVVHDGIADHDKFHEQAGIDPSVCTAGHGQFVQSFVDRGGHGFCATFVHHGVGDAGHDILTILNLRVHQTRRGKHLTILKVT